MIQHWLVQHWLVKIAILAACVCAAQTASAEVSVLVIAPADETIDYAPYENRLRSELLATGFAVSIERVPGRADYASIAVNAQRTGSQAALAINITDSELCGLLWIDNPGKSGGLMRAVRCCPLNDDAPAVFAVRATDALSAGLLELHYPQKTHDTPAPNHAEQKQIERPKPQPKAPAPAPANRATSTVEVAKPPASSVTPRESARREWHLQGGGAVGGWLRDFPLSYGGKLEVSRDVAEGWALGVHGFALAPVAVNRRAGQASIFQFLAGPILQYRQRIVPGLTLVDALGAGVYGISISATAAGSHGSRDAFSLTGYALVEHQVHLDVTRRLSLVLSGAVSVPWTRYSVIIADVTAARAAAPLLFGGVGAELSL